MEVWKPIDDYSEYEVSNFGNVRNKRTGRILCQETVAKGYKRVGLRREGEKWPDHKYVHRLVAGAFFDSDDSRMDVNHIDGDPTNNFVGNLKYCSRSETLQRKHDKNGEIIRVRTKRHAYVVCCKDCIHRNSSEFCTNTDDDFFCADGE